MAPKSIPVDEVTKHNSENDLWTVVDGQVFDLTEFAPEHPGGSDSTKFLPTSDHHMADLLNRQ